MAGLTSTGFVSKTQAQVLTSLQEKATTIFKDLVGENDTVDVGSNTTLGRMLGVIEESLADLWDAAQQVNDAFTIDGATGIALDNLATLVGIQRKKAAPSLVSILNVGDIGTPIPASSLVGSKASGKKFSTLESIVIDNTACIAVTIDVPTVANTTVYSLSFVKVPDSLSEGTFTVSITSDGSATKTEILAAIKAAIDSSYSTTFSTAIGDDGLLTIKLLNVFQKVTFSSSANLSFVKATKMVAASCTETGPIQAAPNTVTTIKTPVLGWDSIYNPASAVLGQDLETDEQLRARIKTTKGVDGVNSFEAIYSALRAIDGVTSLALYENTADTSGYPDGMVSGPTMPPHSVYPIVQGGDTTLIAQAIWKNKAGGIKTFGGTATTVYDSEKIPHDVSFDRPTPVDIYMDLTIHTNTDFPQDGSTKIKDAIIAYMAANWSIGADIEYSRLYSPINSIPGHYVVSFFIGTAPSPVGTSNIAIAYNEIFAISSANINISIA